MRRDAKARSIAMAAFVSGFALIAGCAMQASTDLTSRSERPQAAAPVAAPAPAVPVESVEAPQESNAIAGILAERRRGDYPEIELQDSGFTITEQVRVGNEARSDYQGALALLRQERYDEGIPLLLEVTKNTPDATAPYVDLGIAYLRSGDLERAEEALKTAELLSPGHPIVHNELGILYRKTGHFAEARASYEKALAVFSGFHYARRNLAVLCDLYLADLDCALQNYVAYLDAVGSDPEVEIWISDLENRLAN